MVALLLLLGELPELVEVMEMSVLLFSSSFLPVIFLLPDRTEMVGVATTSRASGASLGVETKAEKGEKKRQNKSVETTEAKCLTPLKAFLWLLSPRRAKTPFKTDTRVTKANTSKHRPPKRRRPLCIFDKSWT